MDNVFEIVRNQMRSKLSWITAITLVPAIVFVCFLFYIFWGIGSYFNDLSVDIIIALFLLGMCIDQFAHIFCCITGSRKGLIMRMGAIAFETLSILWCAIKLCVHSASISEKYIESKVLGYGLVAIVLFVLLWRIMEIVGLVCINIGITGKIKKGVIKSFSVMGMIIAACTLMVTFAIWGIYVDLFSESYTILPEEIYMIGIIWAGFTFIPVYIFFLSLNFLKIWDRVDNLSSEN